MEVYAVNAKLFLPKLAELNFTVLKSEA